MLGFLLTSAVIRKVQILDESRLLIKKFEPQDATNFVLTYFTMAVLQKISLNKENLNFLWLIVPILSLFQILRKPDSFKVRTFWEGHKNLKQSPTSKLQIMWEIVSNFVAFLENLNFNENILKNCQVVIFWMKFFINDYCEGSHYGSISMHCLS